MLNYSLKLRNIPNPLTNYISMLSEHPISRYIERRFTMNAYVYVRKYRIAESEASEAHVVVAQNREKADGLLTDLIPMDGSVALGLFEITEKPINNGVVLL